MAVTVKLDPIAKDIAIILREVRDPKARQRDFANFAREQIAEARANNRAVAGGDPKYTVFVDGSRGAPLESVKPDGGTIVVEFELLTDVLKFIGEQLVRHSPVETGRYQRSHKLLADGTEIDPDAAITKIAAEYIFVNTQPYARKIETGMSPEAPDGVYQAVATLARQRFGNIARINFTYRGIVGGFSAGGRAGRGTRQPSVTVRPR